MCAITLNLRLPNNMTKTQKDNDVDPGQGRARQSLLLNNHINSSQVSISVFTVHIRCGHDPRRPGGRLSKLLVKQSKNRTQRQQQRETSYRVKTYISCLITVSFKKGYVYYDKAGVGARRRRSQRAWIKRPARGRRKAGIFGGLTVPRRAYL